FLPARVGLLMPLNLTYSNTAIDPQLLTGSDIVAAAVPGLRKPNASQTTVNLLIRRSALGGNRWVHLLADPLSFTGSYLHGQAQTELSNAYTNNYNAALSYQVSVVRPGHRFILRKLVASMPGWMRNSDFGNSLMN